jgi:hypothetical protein
VRGKKPLENHLPPTPFSSGEFLASRLGTINIPYPHEEESVELRTVAVLIEDGLKFRFLISVPGINEARSSCKRNSTLSPSASLLPSSLATPIHFWKKLKKGTREGTKINGGIHRNYLKREPRRFVEVLT